EGAGADQQTPHGEQGADGCRHRRRPATRAPAAVEVGADLLAQNASRMLMMAGPMTTTNSDGKMQNTMGISILTGAFWACSWAICRRLMRISSAWARRTRPMETPKVSAWRMASTKDRTSGTLV